MKITNSELRNLDKIAEGGEGEIFKYDNNHVIKIYNKTVDLDNKKKKIQYLLNAGLPEGVIGPEDEVLSTNGNNFIGFMMKKVVGEEIRKLTNKKFISINKITVRDVCNLLVKMGEVIERLHNKNIYIGDLNDQNILFNKDEVYFIDVDSWSINGIPCTVAMDGFRDPMLNGINFNTFTDSYAYAVMCFKCLARIHPFGGTMNPDIDLVERMIKKISVIDNKNVILPSTIGTFKFISPDLLRVFKQIFETASRYMINKDIKEFMNNLGFCNLHTDYYYDKYATCPVCYDNVKVIVKPVQMGVVGSIPYIIIFEDKDVYMVLDLNTALYKGKVNVVEGYVCIKDTVMNIGIDKLPQNTFVNFLSNRNYVVWDKDKFSIMDINNKKVSEDRYIGRFQVEGESIYYINRGLNLCKLTVLNNNVTIETMEKVAFNCIFECVDKKNYFICNSYEDRRVISVSGYNYIMNDDTRKIINYGIHCDEVSGYWLFIMEFGNGKFRTYIFNKNAIVYDSGNLKYDCGLEAICFKNKVIFMPGNKKIVGYNYEKNVYREFECDIVDEDSKLIQKGNKFTVISKDKIYEVG